MDSSVPKREIPKIDRFPITEIRLTISKLAEALKIISKEDEKGGFLRIFQVRNGDLVQIFTDVFGIFDPKDRHSFEESSKEKALRLQNHSRHHSSFESRNEKNGLYGGAIKTKNGFIISCSGMAEEENEALSICLALQLGWSNEEDSSKIAEKSENKIFKKLKKTMGY